LEAAEMKNLKPDFATEGAVKSRWFRSSKAYQSSLRTSLFRVVYDRDPSSLHQPAVQTQMTSWDEFLAEIKERLEQAQQHYKKFYDARHREVEFAVGQWVWLRLIHRPIASLDVKGRGKLRPKFYGPFKILEHIGDVAYKLQLPPGQDSMMYSMLGCSRNSMVSHPLPRRSCHQSITAEHAWSWRL
jgi:hypothetical protein